MLKYFALISALFVSVSAFAQNPGTGTRALLWDFPVNHDPIRIIRVMSGTSELKSDGHKFANPYVWETVFDAGDDWLRNISFVVRNVSTKKITHLQVSCVLQESSDWTAEIAKHKNTPILGQISNTVGRRPEEALYSTRLGHVVKPDARPTFELAPGQEFTIPLGDPESYAALKSRVEDNQPMSSVTACNGGVSAIFFEDATMWQGHQYYSPGAQPGKWIALSFDQWSSYGGNHKEESK